jgi:uncharacterized membrane protein
MIMFKLQPPDWILWNDFLALLPVGMALLLAWWTENGPNWRKRLSTPVWALIWLPLAVAWFAFLPNTCYLLTEWRHFLFDPRLSPLTEPGDYSPRAQLAVARLGLFYLLYSGVGVICYTLSIRPIERLLRRTQLNLLFFGVPFFLLTSLAVYMGLIVRLNSWQVVTRPAIVWATTVHAVTDPPLLKVIVIFAFLLWLLYETVDVWVDGMVLRLRRNKGSAPTSTSGGKRRAKAASKG